MEADDILEKYFGKLLGGTRTVAGNEVSFLGETVDEDGNSRAHDVFHVEKLIPAHDRDPKVFPYADKHESDQDPIEDDIGDYYDEEYEVEKIVSHRFDSRKRLQLKIRWKGFPPEHDTWQTLQDVASAPEALQDYRKSLRSDVRSKFDASLSKM
ncbi:hypothetical protein BGZ94_003764 [Podila epigama]|nr:hypothetical protein BGZ94_003764 [Podila epigama]